MRSLLVPAMAVSAVAAVVAAAPLAAPATGHAPTTVLAPAPRQVTQPATSRAKPSAAVGPAQPSAGTAAGPGRLPAAGTSAVTPGDRWSWPLDPRPEVARPFLRPATRYGVGHRGVDLLGHPGQLVLAVDDGVVSHVGVIAGRGTVTVVHASGLRSTYEPVSATVRRGERVVRGSPVGSLAADGSHCGVVVCLHLGALREDDYVDPLTLLGGARVRLLPLR